MAYVKESWTNGSVNAIDAASLNHLEQQYDEAMAETATRDIPKGLVDAKGDLIVATADGVVTRLAVGADGTFLKADSAAPSGLSYGTPAGGAGGTGDVQFVVARAGAGTTLASSEWVTYPLDGTPSVNVGGGSWNGTTFVYTVPENGLYLCLGAIRSAESIAARSLALAIGTANADGAHVLWGSFGGTNSDQSRTGRQYTRLARFNANDLVRMYIYSDGQTYATQYDAPTTSAAGQFMSIVKIAD